VSLMGVALMAVSLMGASLMGVPLISVPLRNANGPLAVAKKVIIPERNALSDAATGASECLKAWWDQGLPGPAHQARPRGSGLGCTACGEHCAKIILSLTWLNH
jgi:hypothetical protein